MNQYETMIESAYGEALAHIAFGEEREITRGILLDRWPHLKPDAISDVLADALRDALKQGVEREDIDPSWFAS